MSKVLLLVVAILSISCSETQFNSSDEQALLASGVVCNDEKCTTYSVSESAKNPEIQKKTDILFVFDTSESMDEENAMLASRMNGFIENLELNGVDYQICHTIADEDVFRSGVANRWSNGDVAINNKTQNASSVFMKTVDQIKNYRGSGVEEPISAAYHMISSHLNSDCFRKNIPLEVVILSDEDELSCADHCDFEARSYFAYWGIQLEASNYPANLKALANQVMPQSAFTVNAIVKQKGVSDCYVAMRQEGRFHEDLVELTGGILGDICLSDYAGQLSKISENIQKTLADLTLRCDPLGDVKLTASNGMSFETSIVKNRLRLNPGIPAGVDVSLSYDCALDQ